MDGQTNIIWTWYLGGEELNAGRSQTIASVLSGDLCGSTEASAAAVDRVMVEMRHVAASCCEAPHFTRSRYDGWQVVTPRREDARRMAESFRDVARESGMDAKIAIAGGECFIPEDGDLNAACGAAFIASGRAVDAMMLPGIVEVG